jgi:hypothetical protein
MSQVDRLDIDEEAWNYGYEQCNEMILRYLNVLKVSRKFQ